LSTVPDKRQESKQRRAARNRANREALAARRENVGAASAAPTGKASGDPKAGSAGSARGARSAASGSATSTPNTATSTGRRPGELALWAALVLAVAGALAMIFVLKVPVDDRGEVVPTGPGRLGGLTLAAREAVTGEPVPDRDVSYVDAYGMGGVIPTAVPIALAAFAVWASRRQDRSRLLTYAMLGMAVAVLFGGGLFFYPALIFVAIGGFLARRADLPARAAERAARTTAPRGGAGGGGLFGQGGLFGGGRSRGTVIDADSEDVTDESPERTTARDRPAEDQVADVADDDEAASDTSDDTPVDKPVDKADPLAELEAELEAERAAEDADDRTRRER
jgi:hypothetical protein